MRNGLAAGPLPPDLSFGAEITSACSMPPTFSPLVAYAIKWNETADLPNAATIVSADGGHGLFQLTASYPPNWDAPYVNALYAITDYLFPAETYWADQAQGDDLVRCIAAEFNAGRAQAIKGHDAGDIDAHTTNHYAARALATYQRLLAGKSPE